MTVDELRRAATRVTDSNADMKSSLRNPIAAQAAIQNQKSEIRNPKWIARRLAKLRSRLRRKQLDAPLVTDEINVRSLSGFTGDSSVLLITPSDALIITDFRYLEQAGMECKGYQVVRHKRGTP